MKIDERDVISVKECMNKTLPRPRRKKTILVTGWNEWLQVVTVECEV